MEELLRHYREVCGMQACVGIDGDGPIRVRNHELCAVTMPPRLGATVRVRMHEVPGRCGPVSAYPSGGRWMFLAQPDLPDIRPRCDLDQANAGIVDAATIPLPSPEGLRRWIVAPTDSYLPSRDQIVRAVRWCREHRLHESGGVR
ncbi:DNA-directed RNA polymerase subunit beta [Nocardia sp. NPDC050697]|uniref:DNA-directed RNA polymerase subunit beta n=1 Tax=Nocardia sp. NPDC050697 TaxID=3155158 RepID=UPI0034077F6F